MPADRKVSPVALRVAGVICVATGVAALWLSGIAPSSSELREWGDDLGAAGPLLWPLVFAVVNFVVPWPLIAGATGAIFGTAAGTPIALAGVLLASTLQFGVARTTAGERLRRRVSERLPRIDEMLAPQRLPGRLLQPPRARHPVGGGELRGGARARAPARSPAGHRRWRHAEGVRVRRARGSFDDLSRPEALAAIGLLVALGLSGLFVARREFRSTP